MSSHSKPRHNNAFEVSQHVLPAHVRTFLLPEELDLDRELCQNLCRTQLSDDRWVMYYFSALGLDRIYIGITYSLRLNMYNFSALGLGVVPLEAAVGRALGRNVVLDLRVVADV